MGGDDDRADRSRKACEACRRKKTKCTAERPICSFCERYKTRCIYLPRERARSTLNTRRSAQSVVEPQSSQDDTQLRVQILESQVRALCQFIEPEILSTQRRQPWQPGSVSGVETATMHETHLSETTNEPSRVLVQELVQIYKSRLHHQPLSLFRCELLLDWLLAADRCLLWSFLAITLDFCDRDAIARLGLDEADHYFSIAQRRVMDLLAQGTCSIELTQALCLIALRQIRTSSLSLAFLTIGNAARTESIRGSTEHDTTEYREELSARCFWSVYTLERLVFAQGTCLTQSAWAPPYPKSAAIPPACRDFVEYHPDLANGDDTIEDIGIEGYCLQLVTIWGQVSLHLRELRTGKIESPWAQDSSYAKIMVALNTFEEKFSQKHLERSVSFSRRDLAELQRDETYWRPWLMVQVIAHASMAMLNHPFIHHVLGIRKRGTAPSKLFLQQAVDQALFHSGWVFRVVSACARVGFDIVDPCMIHVVAATATVPFFFQHTKDIEVAERARSNLNAGLSALAVAAESWPCATWKLELLQRLSLGASDTDDKIKFHIPSLWDLLDSQPVQAIGSSSSCQQTSHASLRVLRHIIHPVDDEPPSAASSVQPEQSLFMPTLESTGQFSMEDIYGYMNQDEQGWLV